MKGGGFSRYRGKEFFLLLIVILGTFILIWRWDRTPFLTTLLPPDEPLRLSHETFLPSESESNKEDVVEVEVDRYRDSGEKSAAEKERTLDLTPQVNFTRGITKDDQAVELEVIDHAESSEMADLARPTNAESKSSSMLPQDEKNYPVLERSQTCNYAKGKWVTDDRSPSYSGFECKQWLAQMWACRLMQRTDFSYEKLSWQPTNCEMEEFEGAKFLERMRDKTLAFVGDSLGRQQFQSLMCMVTGGKWVPDVIDAGPEYGLVIPEGGSRPNGWAYRFPNTNTTILYYWSSCLCDLEPIDVQNPATEYAMHLDRPPAFLRQFLHKIDVLVLNTGHHWNRGKIRGNRWVMYVGGKPNTDKKLATIGDAKNFTVHSIVSWVNKQLPKHPHLKAFYRTISPRHFANGDWNTGGSCDNTVPMSVGKEISQEESSDYSAGNAVKGTGVKLLDITAVSQLRDEGHISKYSITAAPGVHDCLHWCLPGVPDTWNKILFAQITEMSRMQNE
ncbi:TRICHOME BIREFRINGENCE-LIKE 16 [Euphorbia peplus]|nr:TRICHOME BIREFRINGENCE-LIKE 16 [Euphorbia peplus]